MGVVGVGNDGGLPGGGGAGPESQGVRRSESDGEHEKGIPGWQQDNQTFRNGDMTELIQVEDE